MGIQFPAPGPYHLHFEEDVIMKKRDIFESVQHKASFNKLTIEDLDIKDKRIIIRADFNVPLDDNLMITDDRRIRSTLPTINYAIDEGAKIILSSHLGRPKGKPDPRFSLAPVAKRLQRLLNKEVNFAPDCIGSQVESLVSKMKSGDVLLLENHGILTTGKNLLSAFDKIEVLENAAKMTLIADITGRKKGLSSVRLREIERLFR